MAPPLSSSSPLSASALSISALPASRRSVRSTFVSHLGLHPGDHSSLLVRERSAKSAACEHFALHGAFNPAAAERLFCSLRALPSSVLPLVLDLRGVTMLDEKFLARLLRLRRELSAFRPVSFQVAEDSPVSALIFSLGLEERFGLAPALLPLRRTATPALIPAEKSAAREFAVS